MKSSKQFQGKNLDDAIRQACDYFGVPREKLEIEILHDAKGGIFGLMGAKKAEIRAARVQLADQISAFMDGPDAPPAPEESGRSAPKGRPGRQRPANGADGDGKTDGKADAKDSSASGKRGPKSEPARPRKDSPPRAPKSAKNGAPGPAPQAETAHPPDSGDDARDRREELPEIDLETCDRDALFTVVRDIVLGLVKPVVGAVPCRVEISGRRVCAVLDCGEDSALLVGRDGQTLTSVQYLASRMAARRLGGVIRLHVDAGNYRERQDDKLRELASTLAARVKSSGRVQSTRPLSAYQRRIIHLALEDDEAVTTRSKGEGSQRRVLIMPRREGDGNRRDENDGGGSGDL